MPANQPSTRPMDCANDAAGFVTQARSVLVTIIDAVGMDTEHLNLLYSIRSLLDAAFNRIADARDAVPQVAELVSHALAQAIGEQQRQVWQAQAVIQCVTQALCEPRQAAQTAAIGNAALGSSEEPGASAAASGQGAQAH